MGEAVVKIDDCIKVSLPGESPWARIVAIGGERLVKARIVNKLFHEFSAEDQREFTSEHFGATEFLPKLHDFKQGQEAWFERFIDAQFDYWRPVVQQ